MAYITQLYCMCVAGFGKSELFQSHLLSKSCSNILSFCSGWYESQHLPLAGIDLTLSGLCADKVALLLLLVDYNSWETTTPTFPHCFDETLT